MKGAKPTRCPRCGCPATSYSEAALDEIISMRGMGYSLQMIANRLTIDFNEPITKQNVSKLIKKMGLGKQ